MSCTALPVDRIRNCKPEHDLIPVLWCRLDLQIPFVVPDGFGIVRAGESAVCRVEVVGAGRSCGRRRDSGCRDVFATSGQDEAERYQGTPTQPEQFDILLSAFLIIACNIFSKDPDSISKAHVLQRRAGCPELQSLFRVQLRGKTTCYLKVSDLENVLFQSG